MIQTNIVGQGKSATNPIAKQIDHIDTKNAQYISKHKDDNWSAVLLKDLDYVLELYKQSPMNYSFKDINAFISDIKMYINHKLSYYEYRYLLRIFTHKVHDDHTAVQFNNCCLFMYSGFTATCEIKENIVITRDNAVQSQKQSAILLETYSNINKQQLDQQHIAISSQSNKHDTYKVYSGNSLHTIKDKNHIEDIIQLFVVKVDIVNSEYLLGLLKQGDQIVLINREPVLKYLKRVSDYSQRNTNFLQYNMMKQALYLGVMNYLFPVHSITIQRKRKLIKIPLKYTEINDQLKFNIDDLGYCLDSYRRLKLNNIRIYANMQVYKIDKQTMLIVYPSFTLDYDQKLKIIQKSIIGTFKDRRSSNTQKKTQVIQQRNLIVIDLRSNMGGLTQDCFSFIDLILQQQTSHYLLYYQSIYSISPKFMSKWFDTQSALVLNSSLSDIKKKTNLQQIQKVSKDTDKLHKQHKDLIEINYQDNQFSLHKLIQMQSQMYLKDQIPGIVLITNESCKSSCSIFVNTLKLFPQVILIGSDVQSYNGSGNPSSFQLPSQLGRITVPTFRLKFPLDDIYLQTTYANLYMHNSKIPKDTSKYCEWISNNKLYFDQIILKQCTKFALNH